MEYEILGDSLPTVICKMQNGETMFTQTGAMGWMSDDFKMSTTIKGGIFKGITRRFMQESFFLTSYTCTSQEGVISFPSNFPGSIIGYDLKEGESIIAHKRAFLCAQKGVDVKLYFKPKILYGLFSGEGFIMQKITGPGKVFLEIDGGGIKHTLQKGETILVDSGHIASIDQSVGIKMKFIKGLMNLFFAGEGIFLVELTGPGDIFLQTMPIQNVAKSLAPYLSVAKRRGKQIQGNDQANNV